MVRNTLGISVITSKNIVLKSFIHILNVNDMEFELGICMLVPRNIFSNSLYNFLSCFSRMETHPCHLGLTLRPAPETHETQSSEAGPVREGSQWSEKTAPGVGKVLINQT